MASTMRYRQTGPVRFGVAVLGAALLVAACGGSPATTSSGPVSEEITVLCGASEEWCTANTTAFTEQTGIPASFVRLSSGEATARLEAGRAAPEFDVWHGGPADGYVAAGERGLLEPYISPNAAAIRPEWKAPDGSWTGVYVGVLGFCSNGRVLGQIGMQAPTSWQDLLDARYAANVSVAHPSTSGTGFTALWTQVSLAGGDQEQGLSYMRNLRPNLLQFTRSGVGPVQQAGRGEIATGIVFSHDCVRSQEEGFTDLQITFPTEGTGYEVGGVAAVRGAREPEGARAYVDWALTADAQELGPTVGSYQVPTNPDAAVSERSARLDQLTLVDYDFAAAGSARSGLIRRFEAEVDSPPAS
jgi:iron(III) transport system substrate-binding protein